MLVRSYVTALLGIIVLGISAQAQAEQQPEFRLKTYGMVCNQCAYGVEQSLQHTKGVKDVIVELRSAFGSSPCKKISNPRRHLAYMPSGFASGNRIVTRIMT